MAFNEQERERAINGGFRRFGLLYINGNFSLMPELMEKTVPPASLTIKSPAATSHSLDPASRN